MSYNLALPISWALEPKAWTQFAVFGAFIPEAHGLPPASTWLRAAA